MIIFEFLTVIFITICDKIFGTENETAHLIAQSNQRAARFNANCDAVSNGIAQTIRTQSEWSRQQNYSIYLDGEELKLKNLQRQRELEQKQRQFINYQ